MSIMLKQLLDLCGLVSLSGSILFENIICPNPDFIPMSKFSFLKMGPNTKQEICVNFVKFHKI